MNKLRFVLKIIKINKPVMATTWAQIYRSDFINAPTLTRQHTRNASCKQASMCGVEHSSIHTHKHTPSCVDGWGTRAQFGPDILGQYNTQLLSLITLAGTIKPHSAIAHTSQGENLFSLLHRHLSPSWRPQSSPAPLGP